MEHNRGRTQTPKSFTSSSRVKPASPLQASAVTQAEQQPTASTSTPVNADLEDGQPGTAPDVVEKIRSQPLKALSLKKEPLEKSTAMESTTSPEIVPMTSTSAESAKGASPESAPQTEETPEPSELSTSPPTSQSEAASSLGLPPAPDPLQVAAQTYPWLYMSSTLDACFANEEKKETDGPENQPTEDQTQPATESEKPIEFHDELGSDSFAKEAPMIMQSFTSFGEVCERVEAEAFQLAMSTPSLESREPLQAFSAMMDNLDDLQKQASELESSILRLTSSNPASSQEVPQTLSSSSATATQNSAEEEEQPESGVDEEARQKKLLDDANSARAQILGVFAACLPVLRARMANLSMAQELIDNAQENFSLALRMESMGIE